MTRPLSRAAPWVPRESFPRCPMAQRTASPTSGGQMCIRDSTSFVEGDDFSGNQFAVCDIDQDGTEELLISYQDASMAGMVLYVFQYDAGTDAFTTELAEFCLLYTSRCV